MPLESWCVEPDPPASEPNRLSNLNCEQRGSQTHLTQTLTSTALEVKNPLRAFRTGLVVECTGSAIKANAALVACKGIHRHRRLAQIRLRGCLVHVISRRARARNILTKGASTNCGNGQPPKTVKTSINTLWQNLSQFRLVQTSDFEQVELPGRSGCERCRKQRQRPHFVKCLVTQS